MRRHDEKYERDQDAEGNERAAHLRNPGSVARGVMRENQTRMAIGMNTPIHSYHVQSCAKKKVRM